MQDGFPAAGFEPFIKQFPELRKLRNNLEDLYSSFYQYLGITREEMMQIMKVVTEVDVLSGIDKLEYME